MQILNMKELLTSKSMPSFVVGLIPSIAAASSGPENSRKWAKEDAIKAKKDTTSCEGQGDKEKPIHCETMHRTRHENDCKRKLNFIDRMNARAHCPKVGIGCSRLFYVGSTYNISPRYQASLSTPGCPPRS